VFFLALRQLGARKVQTTLILLGILFGTLIYILIAGLQLGMRQYISDQLLNNTAHIRISGSENRIKEEELTPRFFDGLNVRWIVPPSGRRRESYLENYQGWYDRLIRHPDVVSFAPRFTVNAIATRGGIKKAISMQGIIPSRQMRVTSTEDYMRSGSLSDLEGGGNRVILGSGVIDDLGAKLYDTILVSTGSEEARPYRVVGILDFGNKQIDETIAYANLRDVQQLNRTPGRISEISVSLVDIDLSRDLASQWDLLTEDKVENWQQVNAAFMQMIKIQDLVRLIITFSILIVAAFGIYNVLTIMISQKKREIAILRAIGYAPMRILELFMIQGVFLGMAGAVFGMLLGYILCHYIQSIDLGFRVGKGTHLIISFAPSIYVTGFWAAQFAAALASLIPATLASRMNPMQIIRSE
jgi:lipoprotein-releasing system permease protein